MKDRSDGFLSDELVDHNSEQFDYITELHDYLWRFVCVAIPGALGDLHDYVDKAIDKMEATRECHHCHGTTNETTVNDRTVVEFQTDSGSICVGIRDNKLRLVADDFIVIEATASNVILVCNQQKRVVPNA